MKLNIWIILPLLLLFAGHSSATHIVGGEIYYECLGNDIYEVNLKVYRDCGPSNTNNTQFDNNAPLGIYRADGTLVNVVLLPFPGASQVPVIINNPCLQSPPSICIEEAVYTGLVTLPPIAGGYDLVYQRCCRNPSVVNVLNPNTFGATYITHIPGPSEATCNNSAYFTNPPPLVICVGEDFYFDHSATDPDGDSLVYELCTPYTGGDQFNPAPNPPSAPPYNFITWNAGYSATAPLGANPALTIDPNTGEMTCTPQMQGIYTYAVCVKEFRNGVMINENRRDFQVTVTQCTVNVVAAAPAQTNFCDGLSVSLGNNSIGASSYFWDFGDPNILSDTSDQFAPNYTYTDSGTYTIMLVANPGWSCADTAYVDYEMYPAVIAEYPPVAGMCISDNLFSLQADGQFGPNATFDWQFGPLGTPSTSTISNPIVTFSDTGYFPVTLTVEENGCLDVYTDTIVVYPPPEVSFSIPSLEGCAAYTVQFSDSSFAWTNIYYEWNFGDGNLSNEQNPLHTYVSPGTYQMQLKIWTDSGCVGTATSDPATITVFPSPVADFTVDPLENSIFTPNITIWNNSFGDTAHLFYIGDGNTSTDEVIEHTYADTGWYPVSQWVINEYGCTDSLTQLVRINPELLFFAPNAFTPDGDGLNEIWQPYVGGVDVYELYVYDRWGQVIWSTETTTDGWNGVPVGGSQIAPVGVYPFLAICRDMNTKVIHRYQGHITIVK